MVCSIANTSLHATYNGESVSSGTTTKDCRATSFGPCHAMGAAKVHSPEWSVVWGLANDAQSKYHSTILSSL
ncbi:hypothetical protein SUGI_0374830 [Cryptomeria japonica]|nr:hypothetical protein SUGI_0374830 [Cryptomeria japonica]